MKEGMTMKKILVTMMLVCAALAARGQSLGNPLATNFTATTTAAVQLFPVSNGVNVVAISVCNTGGVPLKVWGANMTNIITVVPVGGGATKIQTNVDSTVTNVTHAGYVLPASTGYFSIQIDGFTDKRTWWGVGVGGTAAGIVIPEIKVSQP
jgi:hypothetical protein